MVQLLQCHLRAAELEIRAAEELLRSDLGVKGIKAQILWRIEELEERKETNVQEGGAPDRAHPRDGGART